MSLVCHHGLQSFHKRSCGARIQAGFGGATPSWTPSRWQSFYCAERGQICQEKFLPSARLHVKSHFTFRQAERRFQSTQSPAISYRLAAAFSAKGHRFNPDQHYYQPDSSQSLPPQSKDRFDSGQDAFFISELGPERRGEQEHGSVAFGVADGVGGWAESGIDPADFSHGLCQQFAAAALQYEPSESGKALTPRTLMETGYKRLIKDKSFIGGGSTACVAVARNDGTVEVANLGDSGFTHLRLLTVRHTSPSQTHAFNTPYQLSHIPPRLLASHASFGSQMLHDLPRDANVSTHRVRHGDVLVFASDGVWDNLSSMDLLEVVGKEMLAVGGWEVGPDEKGVQVGRRLERLTAGRRPDTDRDGVVNESLQRLLAVGITAAAKSASMNTKVDGPFAKEVRRLYPDEDYRGGKVDDICVVVAVAVQRESQ